LIKQVLEGQTATHKTLGHLDRCLTCRSCETTCPSGVRYGRLLEIGREVLEPRVRRSLRERLLRRALLSVVPYHHRFTALLRLGQALRPLLPSSVRSKLPEHRPAPPRPSRRHARTMLILEGCVQPGAAPATNAAAARVLDRLGVSLIAAAGVGCCGAAPLHTGDPTTAQRMMRSNIDAWWPHIQSGCEALVITASGCGVHVKDYGTSLRHDPAYAAKAARVSALARDLSEVLGAEDLGQLRVQGEGRRVAFHAPCTLQHGQRLNGIVESILSRLGFVLTPVPDAHLCCGSAGTYSLLQPRLAKSLLTNKLAALEAAKPELIATANIGCQLHLATRARVPVRHWIELLDTQA
jgi:glycolate oxidase iron-sulfur subunit